MKLFTYTSKGSGYQSLLSVFAEMQFQSFSELSMCNKKEIVSEWWEAPDNMDARIDFLIDFSSSGAITEMLYGSIDAKQVGDKLFENILTHSNIVNSINIDLDEAFCDYMMSLDGDGRDDDDVFIHEDIWNRNLGSSETKNQRIGV